MDKILYVERRLKKEEKINLFPITITRHCEEPRPLPAQPNARNGPEFVCDNFLP